MTDLITTGGATGPVKTVETGKIGEQANESETKITDICFLCLKHP